MEDTVRVLMISANTEQITMPVLPVGMARVAAAVEQAGHEIRILNLMRPEHAPGGLQEALEEFAPEAIGVSVRNIDDQNREAPKFLLPPVRKVVDECKRLSGAPVILGGPGYSIFPREVLAYLGADYGIQGEGEEAFPQLLSRMKTGGPAADIPGIVLPGGASGPPPQRLRRLDAYPLPRPGVHLTVPEGEDGGELWVPFQTRRGCPMQCSYCSTPAIEGRIMRSQSPKTAARSLLDFADAGYRRFFFVDNIFNMPATHAEALCDSITEAGLDIAWQAIVYPARLTNRLVEKMARAGCTGVALGFESGHPRVLRALNKRFGPGDVRESAKLLRRVGISRMGFLLLGGPGETRDSVEVSVDFADSLGLDSVKLTAGVRIYPGTELAGRAVEEGVIDADADLLHPTFYLRPELDGWLQERVGELTDSKPEWHT
jgi:radical SAM superfamily enzyme YgiQ (UPF0313 family)